MNVWLLQGFQRQESSPRHQRETDGEHRHLEGYVAFVVAGLVVSQDILLLHVLSREAMSEGPHQHQWPLKEVKWHSPCDALM